MDDASTKGISVFLSNITVILSLNVTTVVQTKGSSSRVICVEMLEIYSKVASK